MQAWDFFVTVPDKPGMLAQLGEEFGHAKVNLEGIVAVSHKGHEFVHVLTTNRDEARKVFTKLGWKVEHDREVIVENVDDRPGTLGEHCRHIGDAGINITTCYMATNTRLVMGADDLDALHRAWEGKIAAGAR